MKPKIVRMVAAAVASIAGTIFFLHYEHARHHVSNGMASVVSHATRLAPPIVGATYMGGNWAKNFINAFRREDVAADFAGFRADGFNTVVLLVSWGDFQPVFEPCCQYDERAFERLNFLIERAQEAGMDVVLRLGYAWSFHPDAGDVGVRTHRLLNDARVREAFFAYVARIGEVARRHANVRLIFLSWEDLWLHGIDVRAQRTYQEFITSLPQADPLRQRAKAQDLPAQYGSDAKLFNAYWDWLLMRKVFLPAFARLPELSYEARIDREPVPREGGKDEFDWVGHESTYHPPGADVTTLYWAPFWGARNDGEQLDAKQALHLFGVLLNDVRQHSGGLPMFIDQLNVIDNTVGAERNAVLRATNLPAFMDGAFCAMRNAGVFGYAYWTTKDITESPLYNPSFSYRLDGWDLSVADGAVPESRLQVRPSGDFDLRMIPGDRLRQIIPERRGRLPTTSADGRLAAKVCVSVRLGEPAVLEAIAGATPVRLKLSGATERVCSAIPTLAKDSIMSLEIHDISGTAMLTNVMLYDHIQQGGLYGFDGKEGMLLPSLRKLNARFARPPSAADGCQPIVPANR